MPIAASAMSWGKTAALNSNMRSGLGAVRFGPGRKFDDGSSMVRAHCCSETLVSSLLVFMSSTMGNSIGRRLSIVLASFTLWASMYRKVCVSESFGTGVEEEAFYCLQEGIDVEGGLA